MKFVSITAFCSAVLFITFTSKTKGNLDNWTEYGWPLVFSKHFTGNDFYMSNQYFYSTNLLIDILFCVIVAILFVGVAWLVFNRKNKSRIIHK